MSIELLLKIQIHEDSIPIDALLRAHLERRMDYALSAFADRVLHLVVRVSTEVPSRSPPLHRCDIDIRLRPRGLRVADTGADAFIAVANASERLVQAVTRALERERAWVDGADPALPTDKRRK